MTNIERLKSLSAEEFAKWLCHELQTSDLTLDEIDEVLDEYKDSAPPDYESMMAWLNAPTK